jgi:lysyl-tRNA synthetase class 1
MEKLFYKVEEPESKEDYDFYKYLYPLTKVNSIPEHKPIRIPLKLLTFLSQMQNILSLDKLYEKALSSLGLEKTGKTVSFEEFTTLIKRTENWINEIKNEMTRMTDPKLKRNISNKIDIFTITDTVSKDIVNSLSDKQLEGLMLFRNFLSENDNLDADSIQNKIFTIAKEELDIPPRKLFEAFYLILFGKKSGPRLGPFISMIDKDWLIKRLDQLLDKK